MRPEIRDGALAIQRTMLQRMTVFNTAIGAACAKQTKATPRPVKAAEDNPVDPCPLIWQMYQESLAEAAAWLALYGEVPCGQ